MSQTFLVLSTLLMSIVFIAPSQAGECSASDPCETWAVLDSNNKVINTIVCQLSFCGSGFLGENRVVRQWASNPVTNDTTNTGGYNSDANRTVTYNDTTSTFKVSDSRPVESTVTNVNQNVITTIATTISQEPDVTFTYNDTKAATTQPVGNQEYPNDTDATVSITETTENASNTVSVEGTVTFNDRVTKETATLTISNLFGSNGYLNSLFIDWSFVWEEMLFAWFN
jgi:hypothetical protein